VNGESIDVNRRREDGFSLVEVIIALALLAGVLISMIGLFVLGGQQVKSGRTASEALAVAQSILEEMQGWGFHQTHLGYGLDGSATSYTIDTLNNSTASQWQPLLDSKLLNSYATIEIISVGPTNPAPSLATTRSIRLIVTVHWEEGIRARSIQLGAVRM
jgi:type II secretory pathway pseudopilin PulG